MAIPLTVNGVTFQYPETNDENWGNAATGWAQAITQGVLQRWGGNFTLLSDVNFGPSHGLRSLFFGTRQAASASTGLLRLANGEFVAWRDDADASDLILGVDSSNRLLFGATPLVLSGQIVNADISALANIDVAKLASLTDNRAVVTNGTGKIAASSVTSTELGHLSGVTSAIQTQLNARLPLAGGTMTGNITFPAPSGGTFRLVANSNNLASFSATAGGWARTVFMSRSIDNSAVSSSFGITGANDTLSYWYFNSTSDGGTTASDWLRILSTGVQTANASASAPAYSFINDSNTGFFSAAADQIGVANNGTEISRFTPVGLLTGVGSASAPGMAFLTDSDTGIFSVGANSLGIATGGVERGRIDNTGYWQLGNVGSPSVSTRLGAFLVNPSASSTALSTLAQVTQTANAPVTAQHDGLFARIRREITTSQTDTARFNGVRIEMPIEAPAGQTLSSTDSGGVSNLFIDIARVTGGGSLNLDHANGIWIGGHSQNTGTNKYGLRIGPISASTNNFAIFTETGLVQLGDQVRGVNGTASGPTYSFTNDTNTGVYRSAEDNLAFATGGQRRWRVSDGGHLIGDAGRNLTLSGSSSGTIAVQAPASPTSYNLTLPATVGSPGQVLQTDGSGVTSWITIPGANLAVTTRTTTYAILTTDDVVLCDATSGAFTVTLPTAVGNTGKVFQIKKTDSNVSNVVTIATTSSQTIDGVTTVPVQLQNESVVVVSNGSNWSVISRNNGAPVIMRAYKNGGSISGNRTAAWPTWTAKTIDNYNAFNASTGIFTVPTGQGGAYLVACEFTTAELNFMLANIYITRVVTGSTTNGSAVVTGTNTAGLVPGAHVTVSGTGIPGGTTIVSIDSPTQFTMSANATATGTPSLTIVCRYSEGGPSNLTGSCRGWLNDTVYVIPGDTIEIRGESSDSGARTAASVNYTTHLSIRKIS